MKTLLHVLMRGAVGLAALAPLLGAATAHAAVPPWSPDGPAPDVDGVHLGDRLDRLEARLGPAHANPLTDNPTAEVRSLQFRDGAMLALVGRDKGAARFMLLRPDAGRIAGIGVGATIEQMLGVWGQPSGASGDNAVYSAKSWFIAVTADAQTHRLTRLMLGTTASGVQPTDLPPPPWIKAAGSEAAPAK